MSNDNYAAVELHDITKRFGDIVANDDISLALEKGTVHAIVGENGAGKTTLMNVLYGLYEPDSGTITVDGQEEYFESPRDAIDAGIGMIHQHFQLVPNMTVLQNIVLGHEPVERGLVHESEARERVKDICDRYGFSVDEHLDTPIEELGLGIQQHVEIVKSLYRGAETLILDEPTAVLTPQDVIKLFEVMEELTADGRSIIFITHKLDEAMEAADHITVLRDGETIGTVDADETSRNELARLMVGRDVLFEFQDRSGSPGDVALSVNDLTVTNDRDINQVNNVGFSIREGEIFGIAGVEGNGQEELVEAIAGMRHPKGGSIELNGNDITDMSRREHIEAGIAYVPSDRQSEGLVMDYDLVRNTLLGNQSIEPYSKGNLINWEAVRDQGESIVEEYDVRPPNTKAEAKSLSGGNQQKFLVGREMEHDLSLFIAAQPTRGVDVGSIEFIHERMRELRNEGVAVLLISSKLDEIKRLSDRAAVMYEGNFVDVVDPDGVTEHEFGLMMAGDRPHRASESATEGGVTQ